MCLVRVGRVIHGADDADSVTQHSSQIYYRWRPLPSAQFHMWPEPARAFHMRAHSQSKCFAHSKCRALSQRPHCASGQTCPRTCSPPSPKTTWRPHISSPIVELGLLRGFLNKSTVRWLPLASFTHFTVVLQILHGASTCWPPPRTRILVARPVLGLLRHTAASTRGDPTLSYQPSVGTHRMASLSGVAPARGAS